MGQGAPPPGASRCSARRLATHSFPPRPPGYVLNRPRGENSLRGLALEVKTPSWPPEPAHDAGRDVVPQLSDIHRGSGQSPLQIMWHVRLRPLFEWFDFERGGVTRGQSSVLEDGIDSHPVARGAIRLQHRLEGLSRTATCPRDGSFALAFAQAPRPTGNFTRGRGSVLRSVLSSPLS